jgi:tRNA G18 (ribose-2'-O)-methylase SpoU
MAVLTPVTDPDDPRLKAYRDVRERDLVGRAGLFVAEGRVVLEKLARAGRHPLRSLLIAEPKLPGVRDLLEQFADELPAYVAAQAVMDRIAGFPMHRGVLAVGERRPIAARDLLSGLPESALVVGLSGIANHDNMGGVFRNAAAFGADAVLLDADCCDPLYRKAIRVSVGAALTVPFARLAPGADLIGTLQGAGFEVLALSPRGAVEHRPGVLQAGGSRSRLCGGLWPLRRRHEVSLCGSRPRVPHHKVRRLRLSTLYPGRMVASR